MNNNLRVSPYAPEHADELRAVCIAQASERARTDGVLGVVFGVAAANERAVGFYHHMCFEKLFEYSFGAGLTFCMGL